MGKGQQIWKNWTKWVEKVKNVKKEKIAPGAAHPARASAQPLMQHGQHPRASARAAARCHCSRAHARCWCLPRAPVRAPATLRARRRHFAPFFTCSRPHDVMLTSLMTSAFPLRVFTFFNIFLLIFSLHPHL